MCGRVMNLVTHDVGGITRNKKVRVKITFFERKILSSRDDSENIASRVMNFVT